MKNPTNTQEYPKGLETEKTEKAWSIKVRERKSFQKTSGFVSKPTKDNSNQEPKSK